MKRVSVLDHGYVQLIETWGSDERIIEAARMSTGKGFLGWGTKEAPGDEKLLRFLWQNKHVTPFEMAGATFEIQAPIFVFREWHRHRTQSFNEMSARYTPLPDINYIPTVERLMLNASAGGKQAGAVTGSEALTVEAAIAYRDLLGEMYADQEQFYQDSLRQGIPKEIARIHLPVGRYSRMRASANLRNWLAFEALRSSAKNPAAQWEIRQFADTTLDMLTTAFPRTLALFNEGLK